MTSDVKYLLILLLFGSLTALSAASESTFRSSSQAAALCFGSPRFGALFSGNARFRASSISAYMSRAIDGMGPTMSGRSWFDGDKQCNRCRRMWKSGWCRRDGKEVEPLNVVAGQTYFVEAHGIGFGGTKVTF